MAGSWTGCGRAPVLLVDHGRVERADHLVLVQLVDAVQVDLGGRDAVAGCAIDYVGFRSWHLLDPQLPGETSPIAIGQRYRRCRLSWNRPGLSAAPLDEPLQDRVMTRETGSGGAGWPAAGPARQADRGGTSGHRGDQRRPRAMGAVTSTVLLNRFNILRRSVLWAWPAARARDG